MSDKLTNLLPTSRRHACTREYYFRLGVVLMTILIMLISTAAILLIPSYIFLMGTARAKETRLADITSKLSSADEVALSARLTALSNDATALVALSKERSVSGAMRSILNIPRAGITLSGFTYKPAQGKAPSIILLSGTSATRDALRNYQILLQSLPLAQTVTLPVSVYAKDTNISFTMTLTLAP